MFGAKKIVDSKIIYVYIYIDIKLLFSLCS